MIFDENNSAGRHRSAGESDSGPRRSRRRRSTSSKGDDFSERDAVHPHRRRRSSSSGRGNFDRAVSLEQFPRTTKDSNNTAWLWVLGLLIVAALGFGFYLQQGKSAALLLPGDAPSTLLQPLIDPILAPLETGRTGIADDSLDELEATFRNARETARLDDKDIFSTASTAAQILKEAAEDRERHIERLLKLGSPVSGYLHDPEARTDLPESESKHLELAVTISWQRNSLLYRDRLEELWHRLLRFEKGRFVLPSN